MKIAPLLMTMACLVLNSRAADPSPYVGNWEGIYRVGGGTDWEWLSFVETAPSEGTFTWRLLAGAVLKDYRASGTWDAHDWFGSTSATLIAKQSSDGSLFHITVDIKGDELQVIDVDKDSKVLRVLHRMK
jgi:hypothetical protein